VCVWDLETFVRFVGVFDLGVCFCVQKQLFFVWFCGFSCGFVVFLWFCGFVFCGFGLVVVVLFLWFCGFVVVVFVVMVLFLWFCGFVVVVFVVVVLF